MTTQDSATIGVLIVDDHAIVRDGLRAIIHTQPGLFVVGEAVERITPRRLARDWIDCNCRPGQRAFGYQLIWAIVLGTICIAFLFEMSGRLAACSGRAIPDAMRERIGVRAFAVPFPGG